MCHFCDWDGNCDWLNTSSVSDEHVADSPSEGMSEIGIARRYSVEEYGLVHGPEEMMAEIFARGPIVCSIDSAPAVFNQYAPIFNASSGKYLGGVIRHPAEKNNDTDHDIVIAGWGRDASGVEYWVGRNSFGTRWGEGPGGGWFRLERGKNTLNMESTPCAWATPSKRDVAALNRRRPQQ